jgi:outer membrane receptor for ferrienterochelin and colicin
MTDVSGRPAAPKLFLRLGACAALATALVPLASGQQQVDQTTQPANANGSNITTYRPDFFAEFRPNTAMDMIGRIPGFQFDGGSNARGFSGTGGNVLINGERPPSRSDSLGSVLSRIPAAAVERIDVIRGGAEGIDMQGKAIIANVIRKPDAGLTGAISGGANSNTRGDFGLNGQLQLQDQRDGRLL